ncbi:hypothetical protein PIB30_014137 [Stylosanthes scabra]|uniref:Uncharacterized protein n=1 Tax=Stylosanthes scabra TaxID=79078 RepID=A0ABU6T6B6_9FABA|nr:hypothetical protein [Stylosanthes scabra]
MTDSGQDPDTSGAEEACVAAALNQLNGTMATCNANLVKLLDVAQQQVQVSGSIAVEMKSGVATETTPQKECPDDAARGVTGKSTHSQVVHGADTSGGPTSEEANDPIYVPNVTHLLPSLGGECSDDTVMMGSMIQPLRIPSALRGKLQGRLGDDLQVQRTSTDGCSRPSKLQKVIDLTPEEKKRSGKMRSAQREPKWETGAENIAVTFPSVSTTFHISSSHAFD